MSMNASFFGGTTEAKTVAVRMQADEAISAGDIVRNVAGDEGHIEKASASEGNAIGIAQSSANAGSYSDVVRAGVTKVNFNVAPAASHNGKRVFLSETNGLCQATAPTASGTSIIQIGYLLGGNGSSTTPKVYVDIRVIAHNS